MLRRLVRDVSLRQLAKLITGNSTVKSADTMVMLEGLLEVIPQALADGKLSVWAISAVSALASAPMVLIVPKN